jgi:hydroxyacylglutathione hydrolase
MQVTLVQVTPFQQNCAILRCDTTGKGAIVDPGGDLDLILNAVQQLDVEVEQILLTHGHLDHAGASRDLAKRIDVRILGPHQEDQFWLDKLPDQARMFGIESGVAFTPDQYLIHGERVQVGDIELQVLHCPGHTPGHVAFFDPESRAVILGDLLFHGSIGRTDFPRSDSEALMRSLAEHILSLGDDVTFHCGHGPSGTLGEERRTNPFLTHLVGPGQS